MSVKYRRREAQRLILGAAGAAALVGGGQAGATAHAAPRRTPIILPAAAPADAFGINEAFRAISFGAVSGAGWTRYTVQWFNVQPAPDELNQHYFYDDQGRSLLEMQVAAGMKVAAVVIGTPEWAAVVPDLKPGTSVPRGLNEPVFVDDPEGSGERVANPENPWGAFMHWLAREYAGLLDTFVIWNEAEIPATGSNALYNTWAGTAAEYYRLLAVAHEAVLAANPSATIVTSPYSYFKDQEEGRGQRLPWLDDFGAAVRANGAHVFDAFALNLYRNPHDLWDRMHGGVPQLLAKADTVGFRRRLDEMGAVGKAVWLSELNAMPYDDDLPGWSAAEKNDGFRITQEEQASYVLQAYATALCAGYEKVFFQALQDDPYPVPDELWGLVRFHDDMEDADESRVRPAFVAYQLAATYLGGAERAELFVRTRPDPQNYKRYASRYEWAQHLATFQKGTQRAHVLWNGTASPSQVLLPARGSGAVWMDRFGGVAPLPRGANGQLAVTLEPATRHFKLFGGDPPGYHYVGGPTLLVVENDVSPDAPMGAPGFRPA